jgi:DNA-binding LacI/PurR family transcriptional regulator
MENCHNFTLNEAAKETGRSKGTISKALNNHQRMFDDGAIF